MVVVMCSAKRASVRVKILVATPAIPAKAATGNHAHSVLAMVRLPVVYVTVVGLYKPSAYA
jgi:hypothetical protein